MEIQNLRLLQTFLYKGLKMVMENGSVLRHQLIQQAQKHSKGHESQFIKQRIMKFSLETAV